MRADPAYESRPARPSPASSRTVVMKFGGTSVADPASIDRVARRLVAEHDRGAQVVGVVSAMGNTTDDLLALARQVSAAPEARELDMLLSVGEQISCALVAMAIGELGHRSLSLTGSQAGILTDARHGNAKIVDIRVKRIRTALERDQIVLVTGFQGIRDDEITTLGRGGSDATAVALAAALGASECTIYTDVDGVYSADPRHVQGAEKLGFISYDAMSELAAAGAAVLQLRAVELAQVHGVRLHVRSSFSDAPGTVVGPPVARPIERPLIDGIASGSPEALFRVAAADHAHLFATLAAFSIDLDTIIRLEEDVVFSAPLADREHVGRLLDGLDLEWTARDDLTRISIVGAGMKDHPGVAADVFGVLRDLGLEARFVSTSPIKISFYVPHEAARQAVAALHVRLRPGRQEQQLEVSA